MSASKLTFLQAQKYPYSIQIEDTFVKGYVGEKLVVMVDAKNIIGGHFECIRRVIGILENNIP